MASNILMQRYMDEQQRAPRVLVFAASTRADSFNRMLAKQAAAAIRAQGLSTTYIELRDYPLPLYDGDVEAAQGLPANAKALKQIVSAHDAVVIASPEHNGSCSALLKNTIDWVSRPEPGESHLVAFKGKTAAILSTSPGARGGIRGLKHLRELLQMIGMNVITPEVVIPGSASAFAPDGTLLRAENNAAVEEMAAAVARALSAVAEQAA